MPLNQELMLLISMPDSDINVSQMHIPPKSHFQKAVGMVKIIMWSFEQNENDIKLNFVLNISAYMRKHFFKQFHYTEKQTFLPLAMEL